MAETSAGDLVVGHFRDEFRPERHPFGAASSAPPARSARRAAGESGLSVHRFELRQQPGELAAALVPAATPPTIIIRSAINISLNSDMVAAYAILHAANVQWYPPIGDLNDKIFTFSAVAGSSNVVGRFGGVLWLGSPSTAAHV